MALPKGIKLIYGVRSAKEKGPKGGRSEVQSVLFDRMEFTRTGAEAWLKGHSFKVRQPDITKRYLRYRQVAPEEFVRMRTSSNPNLTIKKLTEEVRHWGAKDITSPPKREHLIGMIKRHFGLETDRSLGPSDIDRLLEVAQKAFRGRKHSNPELGAKHFYEMGYARGQQDRSSADVGISIDPDIKERESFNFLMERAKGFRRFTAKQAEGVRRAFSNGYYDAYGRRPRRARKNPSPPGRLDITKDFGLFHVVITDAQGNTIDVKDFATGPMGMRELMKWTHKKGYDKLPAYRDGRRVNPSPSQLVEEFHGRPSSGETEVEEVERYHKRMAVLGDLTELAVQISKKKELPIVFVSGRPQLCSNAKGTQLEIIGGDQALDVSAFGLSEEEQEKELIELGPLHSVTYFTDKHHLKGPKYQKEGCEYVHVFSEDGGKKPLLVYDGLSKKLLVVGGSYQMSGEGVVN